MLISPKGREVGYAPNGRVLDCLRPKDFTHVNKHGLRTANRLELVTAPAVVETILDIPRQYREEYDQGYEGACVGFSESWQMSILNRQLYDARLLYYEAQKIDEWDDTPPGDGTSLRAGYDVLRTVGHWRIYAGKTRAPKLDAGIAANKWTTKVDELRACIAAGVPGELGIHWYRQFSSPVAKPRLNDAGKPITEFGQQRSDYWIGASDVQWGPIDGDHAICVAGASDRRQAFALLNTWGYAYPFLVWLPYRAYERLMTEEGETGLIIDRPKVA